MSKIDLGNLDSMQYDVLKELGNIGAGNATTALSKLINAKIDMRVPKVNLLGFSELAKAMGREEEIMVGILLLLEGDVDGMMMFLLDVASARALVNSLMGKAEEEANDDINFVISFELFSISLNKNINLSYC